MMKNTVEERFGEIKSKHTSIGIRMITDLKHQEIAFIDDETTANLSVGTLVTFTIHSTNHGLLALDIKRMS